MSKVSLKPNAQGQQVLRWREGGKHRQVTKDISKREAERLRASIEDRLDAGLPDPARFTLAEVGRLYLVDRKPRVSDKTIKDYTDQWERLIEPYLGAYKLSELRRRHVNKWLADLAREGVGQESQRKALTRLRSALKFAIAEEMLGRNVALEVDMPEPPPKKPIVITPLVDVERQRARAIVAGRDRDALIYSLGFYLGLRPSEIFGLVASALNGEKLTIDRRRTLKLEAEAGAMKSTGQVKVGTKTNVIRIVDVPALVVAELQAYIEANGLSGDDLLFPNVNGDPLTENDYINWARRRFNVDRVTSGATPYSMRHTAASMLLHAHGAGKLAYISRQLGHSATESLKTYQHEIDELPDDLALIPVNKAIARARRQVRRESTKLKAVG